VTCPTIRNNLRGWYVTIKTKPKGRVQVDKIKDELPYQADEIPNILLSIGIQQLQGLINT